MVAVVLNNQNTKQTVEVKPSDNLSNTNLKKKVKYKQDKTLVLVGDSMTEVLGNSDEIKEYLKKYYPKKEVEVLNYGFGSTNLLSVPDRLQSPTFYKREFIPIQDIDFDIIFIESFGHNPLSHLSLEEGLKKQEETLDKIVNMVKSSNPKAQIVFIATISPNSQSYAYGSVELAKAKRYEWVNERIAYIKNHIKYAQENKIHLVNVFEKSLNKDGDGNPIYINSTDNIHPSPSGVYLISQEIADYIYNNNLF